MLSLNLWTYAVRRWWCDCCVRVALFMFFETLNIGLLMWCVVIKLWHRVSLQICNFELVCCFVVEQHHVWCVFVIIEMYVWCVLLCCLMNINMLSVLPGSWIYENGCCWKQRLMGWKKHDIKHREHTQLCFGLLL